MTELFEWLTDYRRTKNKIEYIEFQLEQSQSELKRWIEGDLQDVRLTKESLSSKLEGNIAIFENELKYLNTRQDKLKQLISKFDDLDSQILIGKYIDGKTLYEVSEDLTYSYSHIKNCHSRLVKMLYLLDDTLLSDLNENEV